MTSTFKVNRYMTRCQEKSRRKGLFNKYHLISWLFIPKKNACNIKNIEVHNCYDNGLLSSIYKQLLCINYKKVDPLKMAKVSNTLQNKIQESLIST